METILGLLALLAVGVGLTVLPRTARGANTSGPDTSVPLVPTPFTGGSSGARGLINHNPFNIRYRRDIDWRGQVGTDGTFAVFDTDLNGIRAGMINMHTKFVRDGANTVRKLITILSPPSENPTEAYINFVASRVHASPDQPLDFAANVIPISKAIVLFENGTNPFSDNLYHAAYTATGLR